MIFQGFWLLKQSINYHKSIREQLWILTFLEEWTKLKMMENPDFDIANNHLTLRFDRSFIGGPSKKNTTFQQHQIFQFSSSSQFSF